MKRFLLISLGVLVALVVGVLGYAYAQPRLVHLEREIEIDAPPDVIFAEVNDLNRVDRWNPWNEEMDPTVKYEYSDNTVGVGAERSWKGDKLGIGKQRINVSKPNTYVENELWFGKDPKPSKAAHEITATEGGATKVKWTFDGDMGMNPIGRIMGTMMDGMLGPDYEKGLAKLKEVSERAAKDNAEPVDDKKEKTPASTDG
jgi:hypothetical protein